MFALSFFTTLESPMISNHFNCNFSRSLYFITIGLYILWYCKPCNMTHAIKIKIIYFSKSRYFTIYVEPCFSNLFPYHFSSSLFYFIILKLQPFEFTSKIEFVLIKNKGDHFTFKLLKNIFSTNQFQSNKNAKLQKYKYLDSFQNSSRYISEV